MNDYHLHSFLCKHGEGEIYEYVEAAIGQGFAEIGFAEHIPIPGLDDPDGRMRPDEFPIYLNDINEARKKYPEIKIRLGIEADYMPERLDYLREFLLAHPFDFVIGSVHFLGEWDFTNPAHADRIDEFGVNETYQAYYRLLARAADSGLFDVIGHLDIPKKFGRLPTVDLTDEIDQVLAIMKERGLALDVNTSGLRKPIKEIHPAKNILQRACEIGVPVVIGSDAHRPAEVGYFIKETYALIQEIGYKQVCVFEKRKMLLVPIDEIQYSQSTIS